MTEEAFEFLDGYSDGEATDYVESGSITPTQVRGKCSKVTIAIINVFPCPTSLTYLPTSI